MNSKEPTKSEQQKDGRYSPPSVSLPKGGGAIKGIGEKFTANPVTGTGSFSIPLPLSPGRSGFTPALSLSYDSGAGNGPFGFGWSVGYPTITRKTDRGLPKYFDDGESDVFILSGAEDLVPDANQDDEPRDGYRIRRYRPRIEGLFARIERWSNLSDSSDTFWRSISRDNVTTFYGKTPKSRISDPADPTRTFSWLLCESFDDKGNAAVYEYVAEDGRNVNTSLACESNRTEESRTANRYLKRLKYGNQTSRLVQSDLDQTEWLFELVIDYGDHNGENPSLDPTLSWPVRPDPFSNDRAGFEVRTYRRCQRFLMFHRFAELGPEPTLVRDLSLNYDDFPYPTGFDTQAELEHKGSTRIGSFMCSATVTGYGRNGTRKSMPSLELTYSRPQVSQETKTLREESYENLPIGVDGTEYQWLDLNSEGLAGVMTEQGDAWWYKPNLGQGRLGAQQLVAEKPSIALEAGAQFLDLAGDGPLDLVQLNRPNAGFFERDHQNGWSLFTAFVSQPNISWDDPNLRFVDLTGDGHADVLITEDACFCWHASLAEAGFGQRESIGMSTDESQGPKLVFDDTTQTIFLADMSGDGLADLVRIRNGEVCYWPNLGYGRFAAKVTMDDAPVLDASDLFDPRRIRLADIDGSGVVDLIYLSGDGVRLHFNRAGNSWSAPYKLLSFPPIDNVASVTVTDLLGNGTACIAWSNSLPGEVAPLQYVDLMGNTKPHLLVGIKNNLGARTKIKYTSSTQFYLEDKLAGRPWITRLPFPVHVVEQTEVFDDISHNRFVNRFAYHHGYFDGIEREFRGFGMVEQFDTEEFAVLDGDSDDAANIDAASHIPPVKTRTWFHTGVHIGRQHVSNFFAGLIDEIDSGEYYREPGLTDDEARQLLLDDTVLPKGLTVDEEREACRALKGAMLRQEVYALDGTDRQDHPYSVTEQNFTIRLAQPQGENHHAVFFSHPREAISYHYERNPLDPCISHTLTLEVDEFGGVLKSLAVGYGRRLPSTDPVFSDADKTKQTRLLITYTENDFTNPVLDELDAYRTPLPAETRTFELTGFKPANNATRFSFDELTRNNLALLASATEIPYEQAADNVTKQKRLIENVRTLYRKNDLTTLLPVRLVESLALPGEAYKLALTPSLLAHVFKRKRSNQPDEDLLPTPALVLEGNGPDQGAYVVSDGKWWIPSGRVFFYPDADIANTASSAPGERLEAAENFFLPRKFADPFKQTAVVDYDVHRIAPVRTEDAVANVVTAEFDYHTLQPRRITDANGNRAEAAFDALGMVVATALRGKESEDEGDLLEGFVADLPLVTLQAFIAKPLDHAAACLGKATTRIVYDFDRFQRSGQPPFAATLARETHFHDPGGAETKVHFSFTYSDGFGREIQQKIRAEAGDAPKREPDVQLPTGDIGPGPLIHDGNGDPTIANTAIRWVGNGRTVFNNKGKQVRQYEPFFSVTHLYEEEREMTDTGVSPVLFYDPLERVVATLHPNHTYEKVVFDPWQQTTYDVNDTVVASGLQTGDPRSDPDISGYVSEYFKTQPADWQTWHAQRINLPIGNPERDAAKKAAVHADTPATAHLDSLGRPFLTLGDNGPDPAQPAQHLKFTTRVELDIEGNQRAVIDARDRVVMLYDYDLLGTPIHQSSMEAGERWMLNDVVGQPIRAWNSRKHLFRTEYDALRRQVRAFVSGIDATNPTHELLTKRLVYGEQHPEDIARNFRGKVYLHLDQGGVVTNEDHDFKGNLLRSTRRLARDYKQVIDWKAIDAVVPIEPNGTIDLITLEAALVQKLETGRFVSSISYDALNRSVQLIAPRREGASAKRNVIQPVYNEANLLNQVNVWLDHPIEPTGILDTSTLPANSVGVTNIDYNAKGQRTLIHYRNGAETRYEYDDLTFRLIRVKTTRPPGPNSVTSPIFQNASTIQDLHYAYDPAGNITRIFDDALAVVVHGGQEVLPLCEYAYDALYRLIEANGREHISQTAHDFGQQNRRDFDFVGLADHSNDLQALRNYTEQYDYDKVGNFKTIRHLATAQGIWTRTYQYGIDSLIEIGKESNRLSQTEVNNRIEKYTYTDSLGNDVHGCITSIDNMKMGWDHNDQLQRVDLQGGGTAFYVYDASGQRVRKVIESQNGVKRNERVYLGDFETYREYENNGVKLERETLHVMDDKQRIALVETKTVGNGNPVNGPAALQRYQLSNHLGSASVELDHQAQVISYEEYHPYGTPSFQAGLSAAEVSLKRYRYTGTERDEESGFAYHAARYYAPWLGKWTSCDPIGPNGGINLYEYGSSNPIIAFDLTGTVPRKYTKQRVKDTAAKQKAMKTNLSEAKKKGFRIDPMQRRAERFAAKHGRSPVEHHHHSGVKEAAKVKMALDRLGKEMSSLWSKRRDKAIVGLVGSKKTTHHNVARHIDLNEQAKGPKTAKNLEDAARASRERLPKTADMSERVKHDWSRAPEDRTIRYGKSNKPIFDVDSAAGDRMQRANAATSAKVGSADLRGFDEYSAPRGSAVGTGVKSLLKSAGGAALNGLIWMPVLTSDNEGDAGFGVLLVYGAKRFPVAFAALSIPDAFRLGTEIRGEIDKYHEFRAAENEWDWCDGYRVYEAETGRQIRCVTVN